MASDGDGAEKPTVATVVVPDSPTRWVAAPAAVTLRFALFAPAVVAELCKPGAKLTSMVHVAPTAIVLGLAGQLLDCVNTSGFVPVNDMPVIASGKGPEFVSVTG